MLLCILAAQAAAAQDKVCMVTHLMAAEHICETGCTGSETTAQAALKQERPSIAFQVAVV